MNVRVVILRERAVACGGEPGRGRLRSGCPSCDGRRRGGGRCHRSRPRTQGQACPRTCPSSAPHRTGFTAVAAISTRTCPPEATGSAKSPQRGVPYSCKTAARIATPSPGRFTVPRSDTFPPAACRRGLGVARHRAGSAGEGLGAEAAPRHEGGQGEQDQGHHDCLGLATADVGDERADHQQHQTDGGQRRQNRRDVERGGQDQAHRSQNLEGADGLDAAGAEVLDPSPAGGQLLLWLDQLHGAAGQEGYGQQSRNDPQSDVHERSPCRVVSDFGSKSQVAIGDPTWGGQPGPRGEADLASQPGGAHGVPTGAAVRRPVAWSWSGMPPAWANRTVSTTSASAAARTTASGRCWMVLWKASTPAVSSGVVRLPVRRDRRTEKPFMMSLSFLFAGWCSSQQYDGTAPRNVRRRANLTVRCDVSSNW